MNNFQTWYENADMPTQDENGKWYDMEDGLQYDPKFNYSRNGRQERKQLSEKGLEYREKAKIAGGKALKGTKNQKEWAEKIRAKFITSLSEKKDIDLIVQSHYAQHSKFFIKNRNKTAIQIIKILEKINELVDQNNALTEEIKKIVSPFIGKILPFEIKFKWEELEKKQSKIKKEISNLGE